MRAALTPPAAVARRRLSVKININVVAAAHALACLAPGIMGSTYTRSCPRGEQIEVTALWDVRGCRGNYVITVTADAFGQISKVRKHNTATSIHVVVRDTRVDLS